MKRWTRQTGLHITYASLDGVTIIAAGSTRRIEAAFHVRINDYRAAQGFSYLSSNTALR